MRVQSETQPPRGRSHLLSQKSLNLRADVGLPIEIVSQISLAEMISEKKCVVWRCADDIRGGPEEAPHSDGQDGWVLILARCKQAFVAAQLFKCRAWSSRSVRAP